MKKYLRKDCSHEEILCMLKDKGIDVSYDFNQKRAPIIRDPNGEPFVVETGNIFI